MSDPLSGIVTFLFTDIERHTALFERYPAAMPAALARHDILLRKAIEAHDGSVVNRTGDGFFAVFPRASAAVAACVDGQLSLHGEEWRDLGPLKVRMALHAGEAHRLDGDYRGLPVIRTQRILTLGHGGQILLSGTVEALIGEQLPPGVVTRNLGEHRLKYLSRPERIFELRVPGLPDTFLPLLTADQERTNLPAQTTRFIGREHSVGAVQHLLRDSRVRLLTLSGPGGVGKTRLAIQVAAKLLAQFQDGVFFVPFASVGDASIVASIIAQNLGIAVGLDRSAFDRVREHLRNKELLLVLDNLEHLRPAAALIGELLASCPRLKVLVTSRVLLGIYGEHNYLVQPMALPDLRMSQPVDQLARNEAMRLFIDRARAARHDFVLSDTNVRNVARICQRLEGLPLAIELAAVRIRLFSSAALLARLEDRLDFLGGGPRDVPEPKQTLRGTIAWSYDLLDETEKTIFRRLAVFAGGCTLDAAQLVTGASLHDLDAMVGKSLLRREEQEGEPRLTMLDTIREYGLERLTDRGESEQIRSHHAAYYGGLVEEAARHLGTPGLQEWLDRLEVEHDNLRTLLRWHLIHQPEVGLHVGELLWRFWETRGHHVEGGRWLQRLLETAPAPTLLRAKVLFALGFLVFTAEYDATAAQCYFEESVAIFRALGSSLDVGRTLARLARIALVQSDYERARALLEEGLALCRASDDRQGVASALVFLGELAAREGDYPRAQSHHEECLALSRSLSDARSIASNIATLGIVSRLQGDLHRAEDLFTESLAVGRKIGSKAIISWTLSLLGVVVLARGDVGRARRLSEEALALASEAGSFHETHALRLRGLVAVREGDLERGVRLLGAAEATILPAARGALAPDWATEGATAFAAARETLSEATFHRALAEGQAMTAADAIALSWEERVPSLAM